MNTYNINNGYGNVPTTSQGNVGPQPANIPVDNGQIQAFDGYGNPIALQPVDGDQTPILHYGPNYPNGWYDQYYNWYPFAPAPPVQQPQHVIDSGIGIDMTDVHVPLDLGFLADLPGHADFMKNYNDTPFPQWQQQQQQQAVLVHHQAPPLPPQPLTPAPQPVPPPMTPPMVPQAPFQAFSQTSSPVSPPVMVPAAPVNNLSPLNVFPSFPNVSATAQHPTVSVKLRDQWLWNKFNEKTNEMLVTLQGKEIFPRLVFEVDGLKKDSLYQWSIRLVRVLPFQKKWNSKTAERHTTELKANGKLESEEWFSDVKTGKQWEKKGVNDFERCKVYNKPTRSMGKQIVLEGKCMEVSSFGCYQVLLSLVELTEIGGNMMMTQISSFQFAETEFVAVTDYRNNIVKDMKTMYNKFNSKEKQKKATERLNKNGVEQKSGDDSGYNTASRESTVSPMVTSSGATAFNSQYFGADGSAPSTSSQY